VTQTHLLSSPFYSPPLIGLCFSKNFNRPHGISCEGVFIVDEFNGYQYYEDMLIPPQPLLAWIDHEMSTSTVKHVISPSVGILPGNKFVSIKVGQKEEGFSTPHWPLLQ